MRCSARRNTDRGRRRRRARGEAPLTNRAMRSVLLVDLDGTLTDPAEGIVGCFRFALEALGRPAPPAAELTWIIGPPLRGSFADVLDGAADPEEALALYRSCYGTEGLFKAIVYDGVREALAALKEAGARLILCTAKPQVYAARILQHFDLDRYFEAAYGAELDGRLEDKGDLIAHILGERRTRCRRLRHVGRSQARCHSGAAARDPDHRRALGLRRRTGASRGRRGGALRASPRRFPTPSGASSAPMPMAERRMTDRRFETSRIRSSRRAPRFAGRRTRPTA